MSRTDIREAAHAEIVSDLSTLVSDTASALKAGSYKINRYGDLFITAGGQQGNDLRAILDKCGKLADQIEDIQGIFPD